MDFEEYSTQDQKRDATATANFDQRIANSFVEIHQRENLEKFERVKGIP